MPTLIYNTLRAKLSDACSKRARELLVGDFSFNRYVPTHGWVGANAACWGCDDDAYIEGEADPPEWIIEDQRYRRVHFHTAERVPIEFMLTLSASFPLVEFELRCYDESSSEVYYYTAKYGDLFIHEFGEKRCISTGQPCHPGALRKITSGFVTQFFDPNTKEFIGQEFTAGDQVEYEDENGQTLLEGLYEDLTHPFEMKGPGDA